MRVALMVIVGAMLIGCRSEPGDPLAAGDPQAVVNPVPARVGETFRLRVGQVGSIDGGRLLVAFRRVEGDHRCPVDVTCVWAGDALLHVDAAAGRRAWTPLELHFPQQPSSQTFGDYSIRVVALSPQPREGERIPPDSYVGAFEVSRR